MVFHCCLRFFVVVGDCYGGVWFLWLGLSSALMENSTCPFNRSRVPLLAPSLPDVEINEENRCERKHALPHPKKPTISVRDPTLCRSLHFRKQPHERGTRKSTQLVLLAALSCSCLFTILPPMSWSPWQKAIADNPFVVGEAGHTLIHACP